MESHLSVTVANEFIPQAKTRSGKPSVLCRYFMNNGYCFYGEACQFAHSSAGTSNGSVANFRGNDRFLSDDENLLSAESNSFISNGPQTPHSAPPRFDSSRNQSRVFGQAGKDQGDVLQQQFRRMRLQQKMETEAASQIGDNHQNNISSLNVVQFSGQKIDKTSYFISQQMRMELQKQRVLLQSECKDQGLPANIDNYHSLCPLEDLKTAGLSQRLFGHPSTCYRVTNLKDGLQYCIRRIHGFRLLNPKSVQAVEQWKKIQNSNIVQLVEVFTTKNFGDTSLVLVYNFYAGAETLMARHFKGPGVRNVPAADIQAGVMNWVPGVTASGLTKSKQKVMPERLIWSYIIQLSAAIRQIHSLGLACRVIDPSKILLIGNSRLRVNCAGILDMLSSDSEASTPAMISHYQQEDLVSLGKLILALACYSLDAVQRENIHPSLEFLARHYSNDLKSLVVHLLSSQVASNVHSIHEVMPVIGARFYSQLDSTQAKSDLLEAELSKEMENGRLLRIMTKLNCILERSEFSLNSEWSETGDRYLLKLFRDYVFHQVTETGAAWIDFAHIVSCLNKLDAGSSERICLTSRDEQSILVVSYHDLKACMETAFSELLSTNEIAT